MKEKVLSFLQNQVDLEHIPGAAILVSHNNKILLKEAIGSRSIHPEKSPLNIDTVFDLASLTKVVATLPAILKLIDDGHIMLDDKVERFLPDFSQNGKDEIKIRHLLTHTSGLPAHRQYYKDALTADEIIDSICKETIISPIGEKVIYSDLGFILLYKIIEIVTKENYESFVKRTIFEPLSMNETGFRLNYEKERFAPTEKSLITNELKYGIVHDDNAESMGGISGHAGLFSTIDDIAKYASMIEGEGTYQGKKILSKSVLQLARKNFTPNDSNEYRGLGWMLKGPHYAPCGDLFSNLSYGHTGYTGTSIWFDPEEKLHVILLTNRVHVEKKLEILNFRPKLHNLVKAHIQ